MAKRKAEAGGTRAQAEVFGVVKTAASANAACTVVIELQVLVPLVLLNSTGFQTKLEA